MTGGSSTTYGEFDRYRTVGATARDMLGPRRRREVEGRAVHVPRR